MDWADEKAQKVQAEMIRCGGKFSEHKKLIADALRAERERAALAAFDFLGEENQAVLALKCAARIRCWRKATHGENYHGNSELYSSLDSKPTWVRVYFCEKCRTEARHEREGNNG